MALLFCLLSSVLAPPPTGGVAVGGCVAHSGAAGVVRILRAVDGDTVAVDVTGLPAPLDQHALSVRILGDRAPPQRRTDDGARAAVDTPESGSRARCPAEAESAHAAKRFTERFLLTAVATEICGWDKYGGRVLDPGSAPAAWGSQPDARDVLQPHGQRLSAALIAAGHAAPYAGRGPKRDWCDDDTAAPLRLQGANDDGHGLGRRGVCDAAAEDLLDDRGGVR